jgi:hypothetical protein
MRVVDHDSVCTWWEASLRVTMPRVPYRFKVLSDEGAFWVTALGISRADSPRRRPRATPCTCQSCAPPAQSRRFSFAHHASRQRQPKSKSCVGKDVNNFSSRVLHFPVKIVNSFYIQSINLYHLLVLENMEYNSVPIV